MTESQAATTRFCARVAGPFLIVLALMIFARYETFPMLLPAVMGNAPLVLVTGLFTLILGLTLFTAHHHIDTAPAIAITVIALILIVRGATLSLFPEAMISISTHVARVPPILLGATLIAFIVGLWLTFVGWIAKKV
jgi:hypothetical protein